MARSRLVLFVHRGAGMRIGSIPHARHWVGALCAAWACALVAQPVEFFSPQGEVKGVRQVTARFAAAMVPFGDPARARSIRHRLRRKGQGALGGHEELGLRLRPRLARGCALHLHPQGRRHRARWQGARCGPALRVLDRWPGDREKPALRRRAHRRAPGLHPRPRCAGEARDDPRITRTASPPASTSRSACA